jgi:hypothetical protein
MDIDNNQDVFIQQVLSHCHPDQGEIATMEEELEAELDDECDLHSDQQGQVSVTELEAEIVSAFINSKGKEKS